jgi:probable F420-dependent oxidoreductase
VPVRFSLQANLDEGGPRAFLDLARKAEDRGFSTLYVADHPGITASPFALLSAAAGVTSTLRLGTYVLNCGVRDPLAVASEAATVDVFSNGRFVLGLGAGHTPAEWLMIGMEYPRAADRVGRLEEMAAVVPALLRGETVTYHGRHLQLDDAHLDAPHPVQADVPLLIGGNGTRVLQLAARAADIVSLSGLGRTLADGHRHATAWSADEIESRVALVQNVPTIDALVQHVEITDDPAAAAARLAERVEGLRPDDVLAAPFALVGTADALADEVARHEQRWGITSYVVRAPAVDVIGDLIAKVS